MADGFGLLPLQHNRVTICVKTYYAARALVVSQCFVFRPRTTVAPRTSARGGPSPKNWPKPRRQISNANRFDTIDIHRRERRNETRCVRTVGPTDVASVNVAYHIATDGGAVSRDRNAGRRRAPAVARSDEKASARGETTRACGWYLLGRGRGPVTKTDDNRQLRRDTGGPATASITVAPVHS